MPTAPRGCFNCGGNHRAWQCDRPKECGRCGDTSHVAADCDWAEEKCFGCGQIGHLWKKCPARYTD